MALKQLGLNQQAFVVSGDGELHEGANWEAAMFASQHRLDNLNLIIDNNSISMLGFTNEIVSHDSLADRFKSFGWEYREVDGHDVAALHNQLVEMKKTKNSKPKVIVANTIKGRGVPGLENVGLSHILNPDPELIDKLIQENEQQ